jgi:hypothetical protein
MKRIAPLAIAAFAVALSFTLTTPADAGGPRGRKGPHRVDHRQGHHDRRHVDRRHVDRRPRVERRHHPRHRGFDVPRHIHHERYREYRPYFDRHVWFAPHRHRHATYYFPVVVDGYRSYRRYDYCDGALFQPRGSVGYDGGHWGIRIDF